MEKQTQNLETIPDHYVTINSGLGISKPNGLILIPLKYQDQVYGVFELAAFKGYEDYEIAFLEKTAEYTAVALVRIMNTRNILKLLETSTQKENEMRQHESKIRRDMENAQVKADSLTYKLNESIKVNELLLEQVEVLLDDHKIRELPINIQDVKEQMELLKKSFE